MKEEQILEEKKYLNKVIKEIKKQKAYKQGELQHISKQRKEFSLHFSDDFYYMDDEEQLSEGDLLAEFDIASDNINKQITKLNRQEYSPYFGKICFKENKKRKINSYYIGVNNLIREGTSVPLVCDWRAPVSSLFYDYELGNASYKTPNGDVAGEISLKRQFEIKNSQMVKCFDSSLTIGDEILKDVLSKASTKKMKTIIASIQKEQNKIIRNESAINMLVQGVAGSGKTSIALHRIAYLLYQNRNSLKPENILILSPNTLFSSYISDVLPELGEENMSQMSFYRLAKEELSFVNMGLETREENLASLVDNKQRLNEVAYKNTYEFYESLNQFSEKYFDMSFNPKDLKFGKDVIKAKELVTLYNETYKSKKPSVRVEWIVDYIIDRLNITTAVQEIADRLKRIIYPFFEETNILKIYADFLVSIGMKFEFANGNKIRYDDLASLMYLANAFFGLKSRQEVKYLIIDEMQDYSFVHYSIFKDIFKCNKIILGDINQCIEKIMTKKDLKILAEMLDAEYIELNKAYRSTYEITDFACKLKNIDCEKMQRHGQEPLKKEVTKEELNKMVCSLSENKNYNTIALITKTDQEAKQIYMLLNSADATLVLNADEELKNVVVIPGYIAKGLEFDAVIVPNYNKKNYKTFMDNNLLYVAATRSLHELYLLDIKN